jgi:Transposase DDE domain
LNDVTIGVPSCKIADAETSNPGGTPMDRDTFIITVYCLVEDEFKKLRAAYRVRHAGFAPELSDVEVITMEICGEYFKLQTDKDLFAYFAQHYRHFFPTLSERSLFVRQAANLWQFKAALQRRLTCLSGQAADPIQPIDTLPLPVCTYTRAGRDRCFPGQADYGYCAAKELHYYGFKLGLRISRCGMITHCPLLAARPHDINHLEVLVAGFHGLVPADKGFIALHLQQQLTQKQGVSVVTPRKKNMKTSLYPASLVHTCARWRKVIETVGSHLTERFGVHRIRVHDLWHFQHRLIRKVLAHTVAVFLNLKLGRPPLDLDGLVAS